jgi:hypothetical protein
MTLISIPSFRSELWGTTEELLNIVKARTCYRR